MKSEAYHSEIIEREGFRFRAEIFYDTDHEAPWDDGDGNGIVIEPERHYTKKPGHRPLWSSDRNDKWFFDWQGTVKKAREEGWGIDPKFIPMLTEKLGHPPTKGEIAVIGAQSEYDRFRAWLRGDWWYCGVTLTLLSDDPDEDDAVDTDYGHSIRGVEDGFYVTKLGYDYREGRAEWIEELVGNYTNELSRERAERQYWAERDVVTLP